MSERDRAILVVGGAGYIGSHVCKELFNSGYLPVCYDNLIYGHEWAVKWGPLVKGDLHDANLLRQVFARYKPEGVIHLAAFAYVGESVTDPGKYYVNNVAGTLSLLESMRACGVSTIVFSSTCAVYGVPRTVPITETNAPNPVNPYGSSKLMIERILQDYGAAYRTQYIALRYFNAAGADPDGEIGEAHDPETHLIPLIFDAALKRRDELAIFGNSYPTPDGTCIRDYIHVTDLARAHLLSLRLIASGRVSRLSVNLGTGKGYSIMEMIKTAEEVTGKKVPYRIAPPREGDPPVLVADALLAKEVLGWTPQCSDIRQLLRDAWNFHQTNAR
jgi:UDP-arabinose 4-epimerase